MDSKTECNNDAPALCRAVLISEHLLTTMLNGSKCFILTRQNGLLTTMSIVLPEASRSRRLDLRAYGIGQAPLRPALGPLIASFRHNIIIGKMTFFII